MKWFPQKFNDSFALVFVMVLLAGTAWLLLQGVERDVMTILLGAEITWIGQIVSFYFRKSPTEIDPPPERQGVPRGN